MSFLRTHLAAIAALLLVCACSGAQLGMPPSLGELESTEAPESDPALLEASEIGAPGAFPSDVMTDPGELPQLRVANDERTALPLKHTRVSATLVGLTASVRVKQTYTNPSKEPIEATYIFPLPENAAVHAMKMVIGDRTIEAVVQDRRAARVTYETARAAGHTAALLEQERPNVFTESVANIEPGKTIDVEVQYIQDLSYDAGQYEFVFPMVVGPRYIPGAETGQPPSGTGTYADTTRVPDASRITPPYVGKGQRAGHDIAIDLVARGGGAVSRYEVPTHDVTAESLPDGGMHLSLKDKDEIPNRDFVLRYKIAEPRPVATLYASGSAGGAFRLVVQPPALDVDKLVGKREFVFVVDVSGSMTGIPLAMCKVAMRAALQGMRPVDTFNVITFAGSTGKLWKRPRPASDAAIREAIAFADGLGAGGGTEMMEAIREALSFDVEKGRSRYVFFMTDGEVGNDEEILARTSEFVDQLEKKGARARVFGFGVGSSVNRSLLAGIGQKGHGLTVYANHREDPERAVNRFYRYVDRAVLSNVRIDYGALGAEEVFPTEVPDLFASHPIVLHGRYKGSLSGPVTVRATSSSGDVTIPVTIARAPANDGLAVEEVLWARSKIADLEGQLWGGDRAGPTEKIRALGIQYHLVTAFTSFVAVDTSRRVSDGNPRHVNQAVEVPEGVDPAAAGARTSGSSGGYSYEFSDDPLSSGGFGPNDATIRVRPASVAASHRQSRLDMAVTSAQVASVSPGSRGCYCAVLGASEGPSNPEPRSPGAWATLLAMTLLAARRRGARRRRTA